MTNAVTTRWSWWSELARQVLRDVGINGIPGAARIQVILDAFEEVSKQAVEDSFKESRQWDVQWDGGYDPAKLAATVLQTRPIEDKSLMPALLASEKLLELQHTVEARLIRLENAVFLREVVTPLEKQRLAQQIREEREHGKENQ